MERKTGKDYKKKMQDLLNETEKLKQIVVTRLYTLACSHPEAPIETITNDVIKAKSLIGSNRSKEYIKMMEFDTQIKFIDLIEQWIANQHPHQQLNINYENQPIVNNNEGEDIGLNNFK